MARLNIERQNKLEPERMTKAKAEIEKKGYQVHETSEKELRFYFNHHVVSFWPYSGWATGKTINTGRGLQNLLKQI